MAKQTNIRITHNIYGNFRGMVTGEPVAHLGCSEFDVISWMQDKLSQYPDAIISKSSYITLEEYESKVHR